MKTEPRPPRLAEWILERVVPYGVVGESIVGDLRESFSEAVRSRGPLRARWDYWTDVALIAIHRPGRTHLGAHPTSGLTHPGHWLEALGPDARLALRKLVKDPLLSVVGGLGLAVAIAVATGFFTFLTFYYSDPPVEEGDRVVSVDYVGSDGSRSTLFDYRLWKEELESLDDLAAYHIVGRELEGPDVVSGPVEVAEMTASAFRVARVPPLLGRPLLDADEAEGAPPVVVIGHREWRQRFDEDPAVVGREVRLDGTPHTVVGVMPQGFRLPVNQGFWTALAIGARVAPARGPRVHVFGRLAPGVDAAEAEAAAIREELVAEYPELYERRRATVQPYVRHLLDLQHVPAWAIWLLQLFPALILLAVSVNVAVLFYARTALRRAEIAVRRALGASRRRIVGQLFLEALALSAAAAALGLGVAQVGFRQFTLVEDFQESLPYWLLEGLPPQTIPYAAGLAAGVALVVGVLPALPATGRHMRSALREMAGGSGLRMGRAWTVLICAQVAVAVGALPAVVGIAWNYAPPGTPTFPVSEILAFEMRPGVPVGGAAEPGPEGAAPDYTVLQAELLRRVEAIPEVTGVTFSSTQDGVLIEVEGPTAASSSSPHSATRRVDVDYFETLGVPLLAGRPLDSSDAEGGTTAVLVSRAFADRFLAGGATLGRRFRELPIREDATGESGPWLEVVGVVEDMVRPAGGGRASPAVYHPLALGSERLRLLARTRSPPPAALGRRLRELGDGIAPDHDVWTMPMAAIYDPDPVEWRLVLSMVGLATLSVLLLSAAGIAAMMSFAVTQRRRELGIRTALGASRGQLLASIFSVAARRLGIGLAIGSAGALLLDRVAGGDVLKGDVVPLLAFVVALMLLSGLLATLGPARRALRIEPMEALREE